MTTAKRAVNVGTKATAHGSRLDRTVGRLVNEAKDRAMVYPCDRCNMDEGSPVCLMDDRCTGRGPGRAKPEARTVASILDEELLRRAVRSVARNRPRRKEFAWAAVSETFALGSTFSMQLCIRFGLDPDTGADLKTPSGPVEPAAQRSARTGC